MGVRVLPSGGSGSDQTARDAAAAAQAKADAALPKAGGTLTGPLTLSGDPTSALHAASRQFVLAVRDQLVAGAPSALDTLKEIADQLASDESAAATLTNTVAGKAALASVLSGVASTVTLAANGPMTLNAVNVLDASAGAFTATLPAVAAAGVVIIAEKDAAANIATVSGTIRGSSVTIDLQLARESIVFLSLGGGNWWPIAGHKLLSSLDLRFAGGRFRSAWAANTTFKANDTFINPSGVYVYALTDGTTGANYTPAQFAAVPVGAATPSALFVSDAARTSTALGDYPGQVGLWTPPKRSYLERGRLTLTRALVPGDITVTGSGASVAADTDPIFDTGVMLTTGTAASTFYRFKLPTFAATEDLSGVTKIVGSNIRVPTALPAGALVQLDVSSNGFADSNYHTKTVAATSWSLNQGVGVDVWTAVGSEIEGFTATGSGAALSAINAARLSIRTGSAGGALSIAISDVYRMVKTATTGWICATFDDSRADLMTAAKAMAAKGYAGTLFPTNTAIDSTGGVTFKQARRLQQLYGWGVGAHAWSSTDHNSVLTGAALWQQMARTQQDLRSLGFWGEEIGAYWGNQGVQTVAGPAFKTFFSAGRLGDNQGGNVAGNIGTNARVIETLPPIDPYRIRTQIIVGNTGQDDPANIQALCQAAADRKGLFVMCFHAIDANTLSTLQTAIDFAAANPTTVKMGTMRAALETNHLPV